MYQLNKQQFEACIVSLEDCWFRNNYVMANRFAFDDGFKRGFEAAINLQDKKLKAYAAFVNGSITHAELDEVLNDE